MAQTRLSDHERLKVERQIFFFINLRQSNVQTFHNLFTKLCSFSVTCVLQMCKHSTVYIQGCVAF